MVTSLHVYCQKESCSLACDLVDRRKMLTTKVENEITVELAISENISVLKFNTISNVTFTYEFNTNSALCVLSRFYK